MNNAKQMVKMNRSSGGGGGALQHPLIQSPAKSAYQPNEAIHSNTAAGGGLIL